MRTIKEKERVLDNYIESKSKTLKGRQSVRFLMQWICMMEEEMSNGRELEDIAFSTYNELKEQNDIKCDIPSALNMLTEAWVYGERFKDWYNNGGCTKPKSNEKANTDNICISKHARKRMHTRCGLGKKAQDKVAKNAFMNGISLTNATRDVKNYMLQVLDHTQERSNADVRILNDKIFLFKKLENCILLITTMQIPSEIIKKAQLTTV